MSRETTTGLPSSSDSGTLGARWLDGKNAVRYADRSTVAGIIHWSVAPILGDFTGEIEATLSSKTFLGRKESMYRGEYDKVANSIAAPIMRISRALQIDKDDPLFVAMCARAYLIQAKERVEQLRIAAPVTTSRIVDGERVTTVSDPRAEAEAMEEKRAAAKKLLLQFVTGNLPDGSKRFLGGDRKEMALLLGYAVSIAESTASQSQDIVRPMESGGFSAVVHRLREKQAALNDQDEM